MANVSTDLAAFAAFIEARLAEWEAAALACIDINARARMRNGTPPPRWVGTEDSSDIRSEDGILHVKHTWVRERDHIVLHDPASVLDEIAGIRLILAEHVHVRTARNVEGIDFGCRICAYDSAYDEVAPLGWCRTARGVAAIWKRHSDYQAGWAP